MGQGPELGESLWIVAIVTISSQRKSSIGEAFQGSVTMCRC